MEISGKVHLIGQTEKVGSNGFTKRQIIIATDGQYVQYVPIDFVKDKTELLNNYKVGESVTISINIRGNEYNGKYYVSLQGWKIGYAGQHADSIQGAADMINRKIAEDDDSDSLPF